MVKHFTYIARTPVGATKTGTIEAENAEQVKGILEAQGMIVSAITSKEGKRRDPLEALLEKLQRISLTDRAVFTQNLYVMMKSGIPLAKSLAVLSEQTNNKRFRGILNALKLDIEQGKSFSKALEEYPKYFSEVYVNMIAAGEASGKLDSILEQLAIQLKKERVLLGKIRGALTYPIIVIVAMIAIGVAMMIFVIPRIAEIYVEAQATLPLPTRILIAVSTFLVKNGPLSLGMLILVVFFLRFFLRRRSGRRMFHTLILRMPIGGTIVKKVNLARFSRTLQALLKTDIPIVQSFQIIEHTLGNVHYQEAMARAAQSLSKGVTIVESLSKWPRLFPPMVTQMISIGEESGRLDELANEIATFYEEDIDETMSSFSSIIEPILLLILGVGVAAMAVAILLPMYSLTEQI